VSSWSKHGVSTYERQAPLAAWTTEIDRRVLAGEVVFLPSDPHSLAMVPLRNAGQTIAILTLSWFEGPRALPAEMRMRLAHLGDLFATALTRHSAVRALEESRAALEAAQRDLARVTRLTTLGELVVSIAHEVNQPLAAITADATACLNWLARDAPDLDRVRAAVAAMARDGHRAAQVVARIRGLVTREAAVHAPCSMSTVVDSVLPLVAGQLRRDGIALRAALAPELPQVMGESIQLQQVVLNLVLNAADSCREVAAGRRAIDVRTAVTTTHGRPAVLTTVEDSGVGFQGVDPARLFETFYTTKSTGLGMGLSISRTIIERHGGRLWAEGRPAGALFGFTIPAIS
jgi:C4-dicarboxylate-specific signal transduction histidine kinase